VRVAVTGGTGFVGTHLVRALVARGDSVAALARSPVAGEALAGRGCRVVTGELEDAAVRAALLEGAELVFHVAGRTGAPTLDEFRRVNRDLAAVVAREAAARGTSRLVLVSSLAVTGPAARGRSLDERSGPGPVTDYGRSKQEGEQAVRASGAPFTIVRPSAVYGPGDRAFLTLFRLASARGVFPLLGDGRQELSLVYGADLAQALIAAGTSSATLGGTYHAAHDEVIVQRDLGETLSRAVGRPLRFVRLPGPVVRTLLHAGRAAARVTGRSFLPAPDKAHELLAPAWRASSEALRRDTGWSARVPVAEGFPLTAEAYKSAGWI
jgi:nucleoside-diphosphate-sugar epimerase